MTTGTIIMIVCAALYGLIIILHRFIFRNEDNLEGEDEYIPQDPTMGIDGSIGTYGLMVDDFDIDKPE